MRNIGNGLYPNFAAKPGLHQVIRDGIIQDRINKGNGQGKIRMLCTATVTGTTQNAADGLDLNHGAQSMLIKCDKNT